jgi:CHAT domain-containing protein/lipopolysaccharide biosynthesis regulator YciM
MKFSFSILFFLISNASISQNLAFVLELNKVQKLIKNEKFSEANNLLLQIKPIAEKEYRKNSEQFAKFLSLMGSTNTRLQNLEPAIYYYEECINILKNIGKQDDQYYVLTLFNIAELYTIKGQYHKSELIYSEGLERAKKAFGIKSPYYYFYISKVAHYYFSLANYEKAKSYEEITNKFFKEKFGSESGEYLSSTNNLARIYKETGEISKQQELYNEILPILNKLKKESDRKDHITIITLLASINYQFKNYQEAAENFNEVLLYYEKNNGKDHTKYAEVLNNLSVTYDKLGNIEKAIRFQKESINIIAKKKGKKSVSYITAIQNLSAKYMQVGSPDLAEPFIVEGIHLTNEDITEKNLFMSEGEKENYLNSKIYDYYEFNSFSLNYKKTNQAITGEVYNNSIFLKGRLLSSSIALRKSISDSNNNEVITKFNEWIAVKKEIAALYETETTERKDITALEENANRLEKFLILNSKSFTDFKSKEDYKWQDVQKKLKPNEAAIQYIDFEYYHKEWTGKRYYCALVLKAESKYPEMVYLFEESQLKELLSKNSNNDKYSIPLLYGSKDNKKEDLYDLVWKPIENILKRNEKVYIAPSGLLNNISFSALSNKNKYLADEFYLVQLSTTAKIIDSGTSEIDEIKNATLFGGIDYGQNSNQWPYLIGTKEELIETENIFANHNVKTKTFSGTDASESAFKNYTSNSQIIHVATHGFFKSNHSDEILKVEKGKKDFARGGNTSLMSNKESPLLNTGLVFAGANNTKNTGLLTSMEVSEMDLNKTKLVVLSACETGLGDIKGNEGVYGLQRSFKVAGADYILMSLWKVSDVETKNFMTTFYKNLFLEKDIRKAFIKTQQEKSKIQDPYYWAAFVLVE